GLRLLVDGPGRPLLPGPLPGRTAGGPRTLLHVGSFLLVVHVAVGHRRGHLSGGGGAPGGPVFLRGAYGVSQYARPRADRPGHGGGRRRIHGGSGGSGWPAYELGPAAGQPGRYPCRGDRRGSPGEMNIWWLMVIIGIVAVAQRMIFI